MKNWLKLPREIKMHFLLFTMMLQKQFWQHLLTQENVNYQQKVSGRDKTSNVFDAITKTKFL
jgi:hypothetical protein